MVKPSPWLLRKEAAARARLSDSTLANLASEGKGPPFWNPSGGKGGRARYHVELLDRWIMGDERVPQGAQSGFDLSDLVLSHYRLEPLLDGDPAEPREHITETRSGERPSIPPLSSAQDEVGYWRQAESEAEALLRELSDPQG